MKITITSNLVTVGITHNYDELTFILENYNVIENNLIVDLVMYNKTDYENGVLIRGNTNEIKNRITLENDLSDVNIISVSKKITEYINSELNTTSVSLQQSYDWLHDDGSRDIRVSITDDIILKSYLNLIDLIQSSGAPVYSENGMKIIYLSHIEPAHLTILENDYNVLIEYKS